MTSEQYLAAAHGEGITTASPGFERCALFVCDVANIQWWFHRAEPITAFLLAQTLC